LLNGVHRRYFQWAKHGPNILSPDHLEKIRHALAQGVIFGQHWHYCGACSPDYWAFQDFEQFMDYISQSVPGDLYTIWSVKELLGKKTELVHAKYARQREPQSLILTSAQIEAIQSYLNDASNDIIAIFISPHVSAAQIDWYDSDSCEDFMEQVKRYSYPGAQLYVFPFTAISNQDHYLMEAKYPDKKGYVPLKGAY
jgi:hypothetical protein